MLKFLKELFFKNKQKQNERHVGNANMESTKPAAEKNPRHSGESNPVVCDNVVERDKYERVILLTDLLTQSGLTSQELKALSHYFESRALL